MSVSRLILGLLALVGMASSVLATPVRTGTPFMVGIGKNNTGSTTVTVPADAQMLVCTTSGFRNSIGYFSGGSLKIGGQSMTLVQGGDASTGAWQGVMGYKASPPTGTQALAWDWAGTSQATDQGGIMCAAYKDLEPASAVRSTSCTQSTHNPHTTASLTAQAGDLAVAFVFQFVNGGTDTTFTWTGATEVTEFARVGDFADGALAEAAPTGALTITATGAQNQDGGICGLIVTPAGGGPPPPPPPPPPPTVTLRDIDGGPTYFAQFANPLPSTPDFFPIAVWGSYDHTQAHIDQDKAVGLNTYVWVADNTFMAAIRANGMKVVQDEGNRTNVGTETAGWLLADEIDMTEGPGTGYTSLQNIMNGLPQDNRFRYANYGKGVLAWETDSEASGFVNFPGLHLTSADMYFFTDPFLCSSSEGGTLWWHNGLLSSPRTLTSAECRGGWNYGYIVDRLRFLDGLEGGTTPPQRKPIWAFVEVGWPFTETGAQGGRTILPAEVRAAVWQSVIAGARGLIYFQHSFAGPCPTHHVLRETSCYAAIITEVTTINSRLKALAPVLNGPFADGYVTTSSNVRVMAKKAADGSYYVFAGVKQAGTNQAVTFTVASGTAVEVLYENRTLPLTNGQFSDTFADLNTIHLYKITGGQ